MAFFRSLVLTAVVVGLLAGLLSATMQEFLTTPLLHQAEVIESQLPAPSQNAATHETTDGHSHDHGPSWAPEDGLERQLFTGLATVVGTIGFTLLLLVAAEFSGGLAHWRQGLAWGVAGFMIFVLVPSLGLPPELPAMPAADLMARQTWWLGTAVATAAGIGLLIFTRQLVLAVVAVLLLVAPHVIGAPHPADLSSPIPEALHHLFVTRVTVVNFVVWAVLGGLAGALAPRWLVRNDDGLQALTAKSH